MLSEILRLKIRLSLIYDLVDSIQYFLSAYPSRFFIFLHGLKKAFISIALNGGCLCSEPFCKFKKKNEFGFIFGLDN